MKTEHPDAILVWFGTNPSSEDYLGLGIHDGLVKVGWVWFELAGMGCAGGRENAILMHGHFSPLPVRHQNWALRPVTLA